MATWEWACPGCGQAQKSRNGQAVNTLCPACFEKQLAKEEEVSDHQQKERDVQARSDPEARKKGRS